MIATDLTAPMYSPNGHTPPAIDKELLALEAKFAKKLAAAQAACTPVEKDGFNAHHNYRYSSANAILNMLRPVLANAGLAVWPDRANVTYNGKSARILMTMTLIDTETGHSRTSNWEGEGSDALGMDKALLKGDRNAVKCWATAIGLISSEDEDEAAGQNNNQTKSAPRKPAAQAAPANSASKQQIDHMVNMYAEIYNADPDTAQAGVDAMFVQAFNHGLEAATYTEGASIIAKLLSLQRQARNAVATGQVETSHDTSQPSTNPPPPPPAEVPMDYRSAPKLVAQLNTVFEREGIPFRYDNHIHLTNALGLKSYKSAQDAAFWNQLYADALTHGRQKNTATTKVAA